MKDKIEEILSEYNFTSEYVDDEDIKGFLRKDFATLIQQEREDVAWDIFKLLSNVKEYKINHLPRNETNKKYKEIKRLIEEYLESEGVKSNEKDDTPDYTPPMDIKYRNIKDIYKPSITKSESEEAVEGFVREFNNKCLHDSINESYNYPLEEIPNVVYSFVEEYLSSIGKDEE